LVSVHPSIPQGERTRRSVNVCFAFVVRYRTTNAKTVVLLAKGSITPTGKAHGAVVSDPSEIRGHLIGKILFPEKSSFPVIEGGNDVGQEPDGVVGRKDRQTDEIPKHDKHEEIIDAPFLLPELHIQLMDGEAIHDLSQGLGNGLELCSKFLTQRKLRGVAGLSGYGVFQFGHDGVPAPSYSNRKFVSNKRACRGTKSQRHIGTKRRNPESDADRSRTQKAKLLPEHQVIA